MKPIYRTPKRVIAARYLSGRNLDGTPRPGVTYWRDGVTSVTSSRWACLAGWKRSGIRLIAPPAAIATVIASAVEPRGVGAAAMLYAGRAAYMSRSRLRNRRFRRVYIRPLAQVIGPIVGEPSRRPDAWLTVSPDVPGLAGRLVRPMSPAEIAVRDWYGRHLEPVLRWAPDRVMRSYWWLRDGCGPLRNAVRLFRVPTEQLPPRVQIRVRSGFVCAEARKMIREAVPAKLGLADLVESWDQIGPVAVGTWTVRERPPTAVGYAEIRDHLGGLAESEFIVGLTTGGRPVIISLDDDAPHIACSAGSGAGKSVLAKLLAGQVLRRGGRVLIIDRKGSHRWARGLAGVTYCTKPADMHHALIEAAGDADARNDAAMDQEEGWDPGVRVLVIFEEMNATVAQLRQWWEANREKSDPKQSPAINAFRNLMFMGRSAKYNLFGVAQMLTANTTGGPESRENFGIRALARYTANNWKMLAPECPMPRKSKVRGRWQIVIAGEATETQVAFLTDAEVWDLIGSVPVSPSPHTHTTQGVSTGTTDDGDNLITLRDAVGLCSGITYDALKKRRDRARRTGGGPRPRGQRGRSETYDPAEFTAWLESESLIEENVR